MARPKIEIDPIKVTKLASYGCKTEEMARFFECSADTLERRFAAEMAKGRTNLKISLRQWQLKAAENGNTVMLIWLGKQLLDQVDRMRFDLAKVDDETLLEEAKRRLENAENPSVTIQKLISEK